MARNALIQLRRDTAANWTSTNPTLAAGEMGFETDTNKFKIGTGSTAWTSLLYAVTPTQTFTYKVGDTGPGGGIIFFVDRYDEYAGFTYLEMAPTTTHTFRTWAQTSLQYTPVNGADSKALGGGYQNTIDIVAQGNTNAATCAAKYCDDLVTGGQSDWYLPSLGELDLLHSVACLQLGISGFFLDIYISSSEKDVYGEEVFFRSFLTGAGSTFYTYNKGQNGAVAPIRRFS